MKIDITNILTPKAGPYIFYIITKTVEASWCLLQTSLQHMRRDTSLNAVLRASWWSSLVVKHHSLNHAFNSCNRWKSLYARCPIYSGWSKTSVLIFFERMFVILTLCVFRCHGSTQCLTRALLFVGLDDSAETKFTNEISLLLLSCAAWDPLTTLLFDTRNCIHCFPLAQCVWTSLAWLRICVSKLLRLFLCFRIVLQNQSFIARNIRLHNILSLIVI